MNCAKLSLIVIGIAATTSSGFAGNATLDSVVAFSGTVTYDSTHADWRVFAATNNNGNGVLSSSGDGLISSIFTDAATSGQQDGTIPSSWTGGTPVASASADPGFLDVISGSAYAGYTGKPTYAYFTVASPSADYTIDFYIINWGYQSYLDLTLMNGSITNTYNNFASGVSYFEHIKVDVTGSTIGSLTTVRFSDFTGNDTWGQLGFYSAGITAVPEPAVWGLAGLASTGWLLFRRRK